MEIDDFPVCLINIPDRTERLERSKEELKAFFGFEKEISVIKGATNEKASIAIARAHLCCIAHAQESGWPNVIIAEDDIKFTSPAAKAYAQESLLNPPADYDLLLSGIYYGKPLKEGNDYWSRVRSFSATHLYIASSRAYPKLLSFPLTGHIDRWMGPNLECYVSKKFWCVQHDGWSDNVKRNVNYNSYLKPYTILQ